jgi:beta-galactosidase
MAWIGGPDVYRGKSFARKAAGVYCAIATEGARWQGATGICPWVGRLDNAVKSFEPRAVFVSEHNSCFHGGSTLTRTIKVFNDGRATDPLTLKWRLVLDGKEAAAGSKTYQVPPGRDQQDVLSVQLPAPAERKDGTLELELFAQDKCVFKDAKPVAVLPKSGAIEGLSAEALCVLDPEGSVRKWLDARKQAYAELKALDNLPATARVLLVGRDALTAEVKKTGAQAIRDFVLAGKTAVVLEQTAPLEGGELPVPDIRVAGAKKDEAPRPEFRAAGGQSGRISFPAALAHPVMKDLRERDFFTWAGDEMTFRLSYATPSSGAIALVQAGDELRLSPMLAVQVGEGAYVLSQMLVASKLDSEPVADRLLHNALSWAAARASAKPGKTAVFSADDKGLTALLDSTGLNYDPAESPEAAIGKGPEVAVIRAAPAAVNWLRSNDAKVRDFCQKGGWLMLVGLDSNGLDDFNKLVAFQHRLRPFQLESVTLAARTDPLLLGLSDRELNQTSDEVMFSWAHVYYLSKTVFASVVDGPDVASFAQFAAPDMFKIANGLINDDGWPYIHYFDANGASVDLKFDRPETFTGMNIWTNESYFFIKDLELVFDGDEKTVEKYALEATKEKQELAFKPRKASMVTIRIKSHHPGSSSKNLVGIDNVELFRETPKDFEQRVVMLSKPGGLVKYPIGKGGIVLNQIDYAGKDTPANVKKKQAVFSNLLRNMGSSFKVVESSPEPPKPGPKPGPKTAPVKK